MSNAQFKADFAAIIQKAGDKTDALVRNVITSLADSMIEKSPVDTGRFRSNWQCGINSVNTSSANDADRSGESAKSRIQAAIKSMPIGSTCFITNSLPYAQRLEHGWSKQAPAGMVRLSVGELESKVAALARGNA